MVSGEDSPLGLQTASFSLCPCAERPFRHNLLSSFEMLMIHYAKVFCQDTDRGFCHVPRTPPPPAEYCSEPPPGNMAFSVQSALGSSLRMSGNSGFTEFCFLSWKWAEWPQKVLAKCGGFPSIICKYKNVFTETKTPAGVRIC